MTRADALAVGTDADRPRHHGGLVGLFGDGRAEEKACPGLDALQHRGPESAGLKDRFDAGRRAPPPCEREAR